VILFGGIYGAFVVCDANTSKQAKADYASFLRTGKYLHFVQTIPTAVLTIFERLFGQHHISLKCLRRSAYVSLISVTLLFIFSATHKWNTLQHNLLQSNWFFGWMIAIYALIYLPWSIIQDYLNLLKTRLFLRLFAYSKKCNLLILLIVAFGDVVL